MGFLDLFRREKRGAEKIELGIADQVIDYVLNLISDKEAIKEELKDIEKIRRLPLDEKEISYLPIYLSLERVILAKKPTLTKEYFSKETLKKPREYTQENLRKVIRDKFEINNMSDNFRILFLEEPQRNLLLYEIMCQELVHLMPDNLKKKIPEMLLREKGKIFSNIKAKDSIVDFSSLNEKIPSRITTTEIIANFKKLFSAFYDRIVESEGKDAADELVINIYNFTELYSYPINSDALQILPKVPIKGAAAAVAGRIVDYASKLFVRQDLIRTQIEKIIDARMLLPEEKEKMYFDIYLELEKLIAQHKPPAVKRAYTIEEVRKEIRNNIDIQGLEHRFKLLFLEKDEQIIELYMVLYELFLKQIFYIWKKSDIQKFIDENVGNTMLEGFLIEKEKINFGSLERISGLPKNKLSAAVKDLSRILLILHKKLKEIAGDNKADKAIADSYSQLKTQYGQLPIYSDFIRTVPEGLLDFEKRVSLSPKAAEQVVTSLVEILKKEKIEEQLKAFEEAKKLPLEEQSEAFFKIYLDFQHYIIEQRPHHKGKEFSLPELREIIRKNVNIKDLEDKFQLLFLREDEVLVKLVRDLIKECCINFIDKKALVEAEKELIKKNRMLKDIEISDEGSIDFEPFFEELKKLRADRVKILNTTLSSVIFVVYEKAKSILGELQAKKLFETAYANLQKKYGATLLQVLKIVPKGVLEAEKFELLGQEEMEKTAKEMVKVDTLKGEFMNIAAHELKTPLVPIISYIEMLINDKRIPRDAKEKLKICLSSTKREADLVSDVLDISKIEAGSMKFEFETADMVEILKEATTGLGPAVKQKKLYFKVDIPSKLPYLRSDRRRLMQVVTNLINNATKFTEKGGITVKARLKGSDILVSVSDTGMGISSDNQKKLFTKFFQADTTERRKQGGTGLGLAICKGIIEGHKGKMWVESELGKGATFYFTVPYTPTKSKK